MVRTGATTAIAAIIAIAPSHAHPPAPSHAHPPAPSHAHPPALVPHAGDWEGVGAHRLPLSFELVRRHRRLVATSIALGSPFRCPADERDAEAVPLSGVTYAGPGGRPVSGGPSKTSAVLSGRLPGGSVTGSLTGNFTSARSGTFSIQIAGDVGCGWPAGTLTWQVRPATRQAVADGTWSAALSGPGIARGKVRLLVAGQGRVVDSFKASFRCQTGTRVFQNSFKASPAYEFIRASGVFYSPLGRATTWSGRFSPGGYLSGTLSIYDVCARHLVQAQFVGGPGRPAPPPVTKPGSRRHGGGARRRPRRRPRTPGSVAGSRSRAP